MVHWFFLVVSHVSKGAWHGGCLAHELWGGGDPCESWRVAKQNTFWVTVLNLCFLFWFGGCFFFLPDSKTMVSIFHFIMALVFFSVCLFLDKYKTDSCGNLASETFKILWTHSSEEHLNVVGVLNPSAKKPLLLQLVRMQIWFAIRAF